MPFERQYFTFSGLKPGETMNFAPAATAASACSLVSTVPAPTSISGSSFVMRSMASAAALVRKVISTQRIPPFISARQSGTAFSASSIFTTGTIPQNSICLRISFICIKTSVWSRF